MKFPCCVSAEDRELREKNAAIERQIEQDKKQMKREVKILMLGAGESGKSTVVKQMKIVLQSGFSDQERVEYRLTVFTNMLQSMQAILDAAENWQIDIPDQRSVQAIRANDYQIAEAQHFTPEMFRSFAALWNDPTVQSVVARSREFYLLESTPYYFGDLGRISHPNYIPTEDDILRARIKTTGITELKFEMGKLLCHVFDVGGQRSERKKWINCFENVTSIIFCVALSGYDMPLLEDHRQNRLQESLQLFESVVNSKWFAKTSIILFLNKVDIFRIKLSKSPLEAFFPEYSGGEDVSKAISFILHRFASLNRSKLSIYPHITCATDTGMMKTVFSAIKETILQNSLTQSGLL